MSLPPSAPRGPAEHETVKQQLGLRRVDDLLGLSRQHDPYFKGSPAHWRDARWFAEVWERFGARGHLRFVHYRLLGSGAVTPKGEPYLNTDRHWTDLCIAGACARILGLVDPEAFDDRRNAPPRHYAHPREVPPAPSFTWRWASELPSWEGPEALPPEPPTASPWELLRIPLWQYDLPSIERWTLRWAGLEPPPDRPEVEVVGYDYHHDDQPVLVEVWIEKSTMDDVLAPVCQQLCCNLLSGTGFQSITTVLQLLRRAQRHGKPAHVLYISDYDPAGTRMPVQVARQVQYWRETLGIDVEVTIEPVALTADQVRRYRLPRVPIKETVRAKAGFEARHGEGAVELDALEALHPGVLADLVRHAIEPYRDWTLPGRLADAEREAAGQAVAQWQADTAGLRSDLAEVDRVVWEAADGYQRWLRDLRGELAAALEPERADLAALRDDLQAELEPIVERLQPQLDAMAGRVAAKLDGYRERMTARAEELEADLAAQRERLEELAEEAAQIRDEFDPELPDRPEPAAPDVDRSVLLYDSGRHWWQQLRHFKAAHNGDRPCPEGAPQ